MSSKAVCNCIWMKTDDLEQSQGAEFANLKLYICTPPFFGMLRLVKRRKVVIFMRYFQVNVREKPTELEWMWELWKL